MRKLTLSLLTIFCTIAVAQQDPTDASLFICTRIGAECAPTCAHIMICPAIGEPPVSVSLCHASRPFCNILEQPNKCTATPGPPSTACDESHASDFNCTAAGIFPDANNCSQYFTCTGKNGKSETISCPSGQVYDSTVQSCVTQCNRCTTVKCPKNKNVLLAYKTNPAFYVQCVNTQQFIHRCKEGANTIFDENRQQCIYDCKTAGNFPDRENCTQFYTCTRKGLKFITTKEICPPNNGFVDTKCVHSDTESVSEIS